MRLFQFHGVIHPIINLDKDELFIESLPAPEYIKHKQVHPKTNVYGLGYFLYLLTGLKFAHQRLPPAQRRKAALNFYKLLPESKMVRMYPEDLTSLVIAMLRKNPDARPSWGRQ